MLKTYIDQVNDEILQNDHAKLKKRTKLNLTDIQKLLQLRLSEFYFLIIM